MGVRDKACSILLWLSLWPALRSQLTPRHACLSLSLSLSLSVCVCRVVRLTAGGTADRTIRFWNTSTGTALHHVDTGSQVTSKGVERQRYLCKLIRKCEVQNNGCSSLLYFRCAIWCGQRTWTKSSPLMDTAWTKLPSGAILACRKLLHWRDTPIGRAGL